MFRWASSRKNDFFTLVKEGNDLKILEYISNLRELSAIENALNSDPSLVGLAGGQVRIFVQQDDYQDIL